MIDILYFIGFCQILNQMPIEFMTNVSYLAPEIKPKIKHFCPEPKPKECLIIFHPIEFNLNQF